MIAMRHRIDYGTTDEQYAEVAVAFRGHAVRNPNAVMRTPLTIIQGATDLLRKGIVGPLAPPQGELVDTALRQTQLTRIQTRSCPPMLL